METRDSLPTLEQLKIKLLGEGDRRIKEDDLMQKKQQAFQARTSQGKQLPTRNKKVRKDIECFNCGQSGHFKRDCKNKSKEETPKGQQQQPSRSFTVLAALDADDLNCSSCAANTSFSDLANKTTVEDVINIVPNFEESKQQSDECSENGILSEEYASAEEEDQEPQLVQEPLQSSSQQEDQKNSDIPEQKQLESVVIVRAGLEFFEAEKHITRLTHWKPKSLYYHKRSERQHGARRILIGRKQWPKSMKHW
ncbi:hypothetical protein ACLKA7_017709 [Drosophila subpalustris]